MKITLQDIQQAQKTIQNLIIETPCELSRSCTKLLDPTMQSEIFLKLENNQRTGSFKMRGASNKIVSLTADERKRGVICCSAGNHAQGVALSASLNQVKSVIVMPETAPLTKINATQNYGAEVILKGKMFDEAKEYAYQLCKEKGYVFVHPFEDEKVIAGQGTVGLEVYQQVPDLEMMIVPIGGGGLISGIAVALKTLNPKIKIIGVQTEAVSTMYQMFKKIPADYSQMTPTIADGIAVKVPSQAMFNSFISSYVDDIVTVNEAEIAEAIVFLLERAKTVSEGAGAAALAALLSKKVKPLRKTCAIVCGGNIDLNIISQVIQRGQIQRGRLCDMSVIVPDVPGSLSQITRILAEHKANILEVHHDRVKQGLNLKETRIDFVIETTSHEHIAIIREALKKWGAKVG
jgi:threonine dehydratase